MECGHCSVGSETSARSWDGLRQVCANRGSRPRLTSRQVSRKTLEVVLQIPSQWIIRSKEFSLSLELEFLK